LRIKSRQQLTGYVNNYDIVDLVMVMFQVKYWSLMSLNTTQMISDKVMFLQFLSIFTHTTELHIHSGSKKSKLLYCGRYFKGYTIVLTLNIL